MRDKSRQARIGTMARNQNLAADRTGGVDSPWAIRGKAHVERIQRVKQSIFMDLFVSTLHHFGSEIELERTFVDRKTAHQH